MNPLPNINLNLTDNCTNFTCCFPKPTKKKKKNHTQDATPNQTVDKTAEVFEKKHFNSETEKTETSSF